MIIRQYIITGEPHPQARPRFTKQGHAYKDKKSREYEKKVSSLLLAQGAKPTDKAVGISLTFIKPYLKSWTKRQKNEAEQGKLLATKKPDLDNYIKSVLDGANGILFRDDSQVVRLEAMKVYGKEAKTIIEVEEL